MNWTSIQASDVQKAGPAAIVTQAETQNPGATAQAIADAVAEVRFAIAPGNSLDLDTTKVPNSLKCLTARRAWFALAALIGVGLDKNQGDLQRMDERRLNDMADKKQRVEQPDNADGAAEIQTQPSPKIQPKHRDFTNRSMDGI